MIRQWLILNLQPLPFLVKLMGSIVDRLTFWVLLPTFLLTVWVPGALAFDVEKVADLKALTLRLCNESPTHPSQISDQRWDAKAIEDFVGVDARFRRSFRLSDGEETVIAVSLQGYGNTVQRTRSDLRIRSIPFATVDLGPSCAIRQIRVLDRKGLDVHLLTLNADLEQEGDAEALNPPAPPGEDPDGITVVHVDTGVNYLLPEIAAHMARGSDGDILGYDFWDMDPRPFDLETSRSPYFPIRHGTTVAGVLLREAPMTRLIPYRYPRPDMRRMGDIVAYAVRNNARIIMMPLGSNRETDWLAFARAAEQHPDILFIVSAGNNGRNIDEEPVFPAALPLANMIVVTSADAFGRLARDSNWGAKSVDIMLPAEGIETVDHRGATVEASGSSYAVPRLTAMAVRLLTRNPDWAAADLIAALREKTGRSMERGEPKVNWGWIPNPLDTN